MAWCSVKNRDNFTFYLYTIHVDMAASCSELCGFVNTYIKRMIAVFHCEAFLTPFSVEVLQKIEVIRRKV